MLTFVANDLLFLRTSHVVRGWSRGRIGRDDYFDISFALAKLKERADFDEEMSKRSREQRSTMLSEALVV